MTLMRATVFIRVEGFETSVAYRGEALLQALAKFGEARMTLGEGAALWEGIRDVAAFHDKPGDVWRISVKPSDAIVLAQTLGATALQFDWGGGLIWALMEEGTQICGPE